MAYSKFACIVYICLALQAFCIKLNQKKPQTQSPSQQGS
jgi:hypothetical protein